MKNAIPKAYSFSKEIPAAAVAAFRRAKPSAGGQGQAIEAALKAVAYVAEDTEVTPALASLTKAQRAVLEVIASFDMFTSSNERQMNMPTGAAARRWLGLEPAGPLEKLVAFKLDGKTMKEPAFRAAQLLKEADRSDADEIDDRVERFVKALSIEQRLELWGATNETEWPPYELDRELFFSPNDAALLRKVKGEGRKWAPRYADQRIADDTRSGTSRTGSFAIFIPLVRAKVPIKPEWDALLQIGYGVFGRLTLECVKAIPKERRGAAVVAAMQKEHPAWMLRSVLELLPHVPDPRIVAAAISSSKSVSDSPRDVIKRLKEASNGHPTLLAVIDAHVKGKPAPIQLRVSGSRASFDSKTLSDSERKQILEAGRLYHGKKLPIESLLSPSSQNAEVALYHLEYRALSDATDKHLYDAYQYNSDSGSVFMAGTTTLVADVIQGSVECKEEALSEALEEVLNRDLSPKRKTKAAAKKPTKKKASAPK